jgi:hypothetical protein
VSSDEAAEAVPESAEQTAVTSYDSSGSYDDGYGYEYGYGETSTAVEAKVEEKVEDQPAPAPVTATAGGTGTPPPPPVAKEEEDDDDEGMLRMSFLEHLEELWSRLRKLWPEGGVRAVAGLRQRTLAPGQAGHRRADADRRRSEPGS